MGQFPLRIVVVAVASTLMTGCSYLGSNFTDEKIQYETTTTRAPLEIPPDLSQLPMDERFQVPNKPKVVTANEVAEIEEARKTAAGMQTEEQSVQVLPGTVVAKIVKDGNERYIQCNLAPEAVWNAVLDFWPSVGLQVVKEDARAGIMETNWAENKANLPQDIIRATLGKVLDAVYSTGERDLYRTRLERNEQGGTDIYVTNRRMIEVYTSSREEQTAWQPAPSDPELEAEMLTRLSLRLENEFNPKQKTREEIDTTVFESTQPVYVSKEIKDTDGKTTALEIDESFDRAWRRVGVGLDRVGFNIEDRDRSRGIYYIRYLDPEYEVKKRNDEGIFSRWFGKDKAVEAPLYRVILSQTADNQTTVTAEPDSADVDPLNTISRILNLLQEQVR
ncbi:MAG: outer membrane protein assembly factor BamC [Burkholderiaceae bacterium]|nr:outer membrane protein assembly factor BamC [Burkholderiaceae bacterium]